MGRPKKNQTQEAKASLSTVPVEFSSNNPKFWENMLPAVTEERNSSEKTIQTRSSSVASTSRTGVRRNVAGTFVGLDTYKNLKDGVSPFNNQGRYVDAKDILSLCQQAYWSFSLLRNVIDLKTDIANGKLFIRGGDKKSQEFAAAWADKIDKFDVQDQFYRELNRSGNVFLYKLDGELNRTDIYKQLKIKTGRNIKIPLKYVILNPVDMRIERGLNYLNPNYLRYVEVYDLERLKNPVTDADKQLYSELSPADKKIVREAKNSAYLTIDTDKLIPIFYKKQSYEPFAVPIVFPVLSDIDWKMELKKMDRAIARTVDWAVLLITMGAAEKDGGYNPEAMKMMQELVSSESVKRTIVADYTTEAEWLIPDIGKILDQAKYKQVNEDIEAGLQAVIFGSGEKFANAENKIKFFVEHIEKQRELFLDKFLNKELAQICKELGLQGTPEFYYRKIDISNDIQYKELFLKLTQLGVITPAEFFEAYQDGKLPTKEDSEEAQREYKKLRDSGLYEPLIGGPKESDDAGRPKGTKGIPQKTKKPGKIGTGSILSKEFYELIKTYNSTRDLFFEKMGADKENELQSQLIDVMVQNYALTVNASFWKDNVDDYINNPIEPDQETLLSVDEIAVKDNVNRTQAVFLHLNKKYNEE